tara:strand:+ start:74 stop:250 length:177 start_codon:yes stop_codon:yes gene_type:complete
MKNLELTKNELIITMKALTNLKRNAQILLTSIDTAEYERIKNRIEDIQTKLENNYITK